MTNEKEQNETEQESSETTGSEPIEGITSETTSTFREDKEAN